MSIKDILNQLLRDDFPKVTPEIMALMVAIKKDRMLAHGHSFNCLVLDQSSISGDSAIRGEFSRFLQSLNQILNTDNLPAGMERFQLLVLYEQHWVTVDVQILSDKTSFYFLDSLNNESDYADELAKIACSVFTDVIEINVTYSGLQADLKNCAFFCLDHAVSMAKIPDLHECLASLPKQIPRGMMFLHGAYHHIQVSDFDSELISILRTSQSMSLISNDSRDKKRREQIYEPLELTVRYPDLSSPRKQLSKRMQQKRDKFKVLLRGGSLENELHRHFDDEPFLQRVNFTKEERNSPKRPNPYIYYKRALYRQRIQDLLNIHDENQIQLIIDNRDTLLELYPLHEAVIYDLDIESELTKNSDQINSLDIRGLAPLHVAILIGNHTAFFSLLKAGADWKIKTIDQIPLVLFLYRVGNSELIKQLLSMHPECASEKTIDNETLLFEAVRRNDIELMMVLINSGSLVDVKNDSGLTPLHVAVQRQNFAALDLLLAHGANVNAQNDHGDTPLHFAVANENFEIISVLLAANADITLINRKGRTALRDILPDEQEFFGLTRSDIVIDNKMKLVELCLKAGARINDQDSNGMSLLHSVVFWDMHELIPALITNNADVNALTLNLNTPLMLSIIYAKQTSFEALINSGADLNIIRRDGYTAVHLAISKNNSHALSLLITKGAVVNYAAGQDCSPLVLAVQENNLPCIDILLAAGADINQWGDKKRTPLTRAIIDFRADSTQLIQALIDRGAAINQPDGYGKTPLQIAHEKGFEKVKELLISKGADVTDLKDCELLVKKSTHQLPKL